MKPEMHRRDFLKAAPLAAYTATRIAHGEPAPAAGNLMAREKQPFVAIQMGPHTMLDEGIERCLDIIQENSSVNAVMPYSHGYNNAFVKALRDRADHGLPLTDNSQREFPLVWVRTHEKFYRNTSLRHQQVDDTFEHAKRDLFAELVEPCRKRGIKIYPRVLEAGSRTIANFGKVVTRDINGRPTGTACWNHPEYIAFWLATVEDLFRSYELDGFQWGAERAGPLMNVILPWNDAPPTCFCEFCRARAKANGIDSERAKTGYRELCEYLRGLMAGQPKPADGVFAVFLRHLMRYPEILAWEYQYRLGREELMKGMYETIKRIKSEAQVGWHVDHQPSSFDMVYRAEMSYAEMAPYSDFIKIIVYHAVLGPRIRSWYLERFHRTVLGDLSLDQSLDLYYALFGYDKNIEPKVDELSAKGFSPDYVYRETKRSVASAAGKTKIYPGIGLDVPGSPADNPEAIYEAVLKAFDAGAGGIVVSREYEEMKVPHLKAVGRAVRQLAARK